MIKNISVALEVPLSVTIMLGILRASWKIGHDKRASLIKIRYLDYILHVGHG